MSSKKYKNNLIHDILLKKKKELIHEKNTQQENDKILGIFDLEAQINKMEEIIIKKNKLIISKQEDINNLKTDIKDIKNKIFLLKQKIKNINIQKEKINKNISMNNNLKLKKFKDIKNKYLKNEIKINYKFFENNVNNGIYFEYSDLILEILKNNKNYNLNNVNILYSNNDIYSLISNRLYCFDPNILCRKDILMNILKNKRYIPNKFIWNRFDQINFPKLRTDKIWFAKPLISGMSKGIIISNNPIKSLNSTISSEHNYIIEEEIKCNLINKRKWDIRFYVCHTYENKVFSTYLFEEGLIRFATEIYSNKLDKYSHITNTCMIKTDDNLDRYQKIYNKNNTYYNKINNKIKNILNDISKDILKKINKTYNSNFKREVHLFAYDFVIDKFNNPFLIDINKQPASIYSRNSLNVSNMKKRLAKSYFDKFINTYFFKNMRYRNNFTLISSLRI